MWDSGSYKIYVNVHKSPHEWNKGLIVWEASDLVIFFNEYGICSILPSKSIQINIRLNLYIYTHHLHTCKLIYCELWPGIISDPGCGKWSLGTLDPLQIIFEDKTIGYLIKAPLSEKLFCYKNHLANQSSSQIPQHLPPILHHPKRSPRINNQLGPERSHVG